MNYLFFDIECCDGKHICEFGYVLSNDKFELLERDCITINPQNSFKLSGRGHESDIKLAFSEEQYFSSPKFDEVYEKIKSVVEREDCLIVGFNIKSDQKFLATACGIYQLEKLNFKHVDFQQMYKFYTDSPNVTSVEKIVKALDIDGITLHKSDDDAYAVFCAFKHICQKEGMSASDMIVYLEQKARQIKNRKKKPLQHIESTPTTIGDLLASKKKLK